MLVFIDTEVGIDSQKAQINGAAVPVTATFGFTLASLVINDVCLTVS